MTALDRVLSLVQREKRNGQDSWIASCPVSSHGQGRGDRNPSLSIAYDGEKVLVNCMSGCHPQDVVLALGLDWPDLFDTHIADTRGVKVAEWTYQRRDGSPYQRVERWQTPTGKRFVQYLPDADRPGLGKDFKPALYKLPKVLDAIQHGQEVWIVEGEKCVAAAEHLGLVATCCPMGVDGWRDYMAKWFTEGDGCPLVHIVVDNDEPGHRFGATVKASLRAIEVPVKTWQIGLDDPKADLYDHVQAGLVTNDLRPITLNRIRPEGTTMGCLLTTDYPPVRWAVEGILPTGLAILGGPPKVAKSMIALDMALGVACGGRALSELTCHQGAVLYLSLDNDSERRLRQRVNYLLPEATPDLPIEFYTQWPTGPEAVAACQEWVTEQIDNGIDPLLIVVDTLGKVEPNFEGNGYDNAYLASTANLSRWSKFADERDVCVLAVHHDRKSGRGDEDVDWLDRFTGSRGITATAQTLLMIDTKRGENTGHLRVAGRDIDSDDLELVRQGWSWITMDRPKPFYVVSY